MVNQLKMLNVSTSLSGMQDFKSSLFMPALNKYYVIDHFSIHLHTSMCISSLRPCKIYRNIITIFFTITGAFWDDFSKAEVFRRLVVAVAIQRKCYN